MKETLAVDTFRISVSEMCYLGPLFVTLLIEVDLRLLISLAERRNEAFPGSNADFDRDRNYFEEQSHPIIIVTTGVNQQISLVCRTLVCR